MHFYPFLYSSLAAANTYSLTLVYICNLYGYVLLNFFRCCNQCPLLCKEFIIDAWQIYKARVSGADAVLLIAAVLPDQDLSYMSKIAKTLGMAALIEVCTDILSILPLKTNLHAFES